MNDTQIKPCGYYVLIRLDPVEQTTKSGIICKTANELEREKVGNSIGTVLAFGPAAFRGFSNGVDSPEQWGVKVGDKIEFTSYDGKVPKSSDELDADGENMLRLIQDQHIIATVEG